MGPHKDGDVDTRKVEACSSSLSMLTSQVLVQVLVLQPPVQYLNWQSKTSIPSQIAISSHFIGWSSQLSKLSSNTVIRTYPSTSKNVQKSQNSWEFHGPICFGFDPPIHRSTVAVAVARSEAEAAYGRIMDQAWTRDLWDSPHFHDRMYVLCMCII